MSWKAGAASVFAAGVGLVLVAEAGVVGAPLGAALAVGGFGCGVTWRFLEDAIGERERELRGRDAALGGVVGAAVSLVVGLGVRFVS